MLQKYKKISVFPRREDKGFDSMYLRNKDLKFKTEKE
jgi:hypothetical protein